MFSMSDIALSDERPGNRSTINSVIKSSLVGVATSMVASERIGTVAMVRLMKKAITGKRNFIGEPRLRQELSVH